MQGRGRPSRAASRRRRRGRWRRPAPTTTRGASAGSRSRRRRRSAAVMPGTMSNETPAARSAAISSPARPKISGSPDFRRTTRWPCCASRTRSALISSWLTAMVALGLADIDAVGVATALRDDRVGHQPVIDDDVGFLEGALGAERQQILGAGTGADQRDVPDDLRRDLERAERLVLGIADTAGEDLLGDRAGKEARPEAAAVATECRASAARARGGARRDRRDRRRPAPASPRSGRGRGGREPGRRLRCRPRRRAARG